MAIPANYRFGADIGGTFTDVVLIDDQGSYQTKKVPSTPSDYAKGVIEGETRLLSEQYVPPHSIKEIIHGTTVASNTVLENKGARTALITTKGFRDVLELRRLRVPHLYSLFYKPPLPLVTRRLRFEVDERIGANGEVVKVLDEQIVDQVIDRIQEEDIESIAICLLHSYKNDVHERRLGELIRKTFPDIYCSLSVDVLPEIREYERTSTTVINAYLGPIVKKYMDSLVDKTVSAGINAPIRIMQSNGGVMSVGKAIETPARIVESGPAAGVVAAQQIGLRIGVENIISFDMGGTTAKASLIENGELSWTTEHEVGSGISLSSRLVKGGGHAVKIPVVDLAEVGAGGGSIVWIDKGGALKVGPQSAGAYPGPVCYGNGGKHSTVTDANLILGYINPNQLAGGEVKLSYDLAKRSLEENIAAPLSMNLLESAYGIHTVANITMIRAIRAVSTYRGRDPRDFTIVAFGGNGPIHASQIAKELSIKKIIVPPSPGLFSAVGLLEALSEYHFVQTFFSRVLGIDIQALNDSYQALEQRALFDMQQEGYSEPEIAIKRLLDIRYIGQSYELTISCPSGEIDSIVLKKLVDAFHQEHESTYGHKAVEEGIEIVNLRLVSMGKTNRLTPNLDEYALKSSPEIRNRDVYFGSNQGLISTPVITRSYLGKNFEQGPFIIEEYDATVVVPPDCYAKTDDSNNIFIEIG